MGDWPRVNFTDETMRDGMQIASPDILLDDKVALLDALSETGIKRILVGSFVSPKWVPQMAQMDDLVQRFHPKPGVTYYALALNQRGLERARQYSPPLTLDRSEGRPRLFWYLCDIFARRNTNRSVIDQMSDARDTVLKALEDGAQEAVIGIDAAWGSNFLGEFSIDVMMGMLEAQHALWDEAGIKVTSCWLVDAMGYGNPRKMEETLIRIKERWPEINHFHFHLHNANGLAVSNIYEILRTLGPEDTVDIDGTLGGIAGCPFVGTGQVTMLPPTEDVIDMLENLGIPTSVDMDKLIDCVWMCERMVGRPLYGHVSKGGPRPKALSRLYDLNMPFVQTPEQAKHFKLGPKAYEGGLYPWTEPIASPFRDRVEQGRPAYDPPGGEWPWKQPFFPKPEDLGLR